MWISSSPSPASARRASTSARFTATRAAPALRASSTRSLPGSSSTWVRTAEASSTALLLTRGLGTPLCDQIVHERLIAWHVFAHNGSCLPDRLVRRHQRDAAMLQDQQDRIAHAESKRLAELGRDHNSAAVRNFCADRSHRTLPGIAPCGATLCHKTGYCGMVRLVCQHGTECLNTADQRLFHVDFLGRRGRHAQWVSTQHHEVGQLARLKRAAPPLVEREPGATARVPGERLGGRNRLISPQHTG